VSTFIWGNFTAQAQFIFTNGNPDDPTIDSLRQTNLLVEMNRIITSMSLYNPNLFAGVTLSPTTSSLLAQNPTCQQLVQLNRLLLHDALNNCGSDWSVNTQPDLSGSAQVNLFVKPPPELTISKNRPAQQYAILINGSGIQQFDDGSVQINLINSGNGYVSTSASTMQIQAEKFGHFGLGDGCDDPEPAPGVGKWLKIGPGCSADTNRISLVWSVSLGRTFDGLAAGILSVREPGLSPDVYTPYSLYYNAASTNIMAEAVLITTNVDIGCCTNYSLQPWTNSYSQVFWSMVTTITTNTDNVLRQVKAYQTFVNITAPDACHTKLDFYLASQVATNQDQYGVFTNITGQPFVTWTIQNPDPATTNKLSIAECRHGVCGMTNSLVETTSTGGVTWTLTQGTGTETRVEQHVVSFLGSPATNRVEMDTIQYANSSTPAYQCQETYNFYPWGSELMETSIPNSPSNLVTTYRYYNHDDPVNDPDNYGFGQLGLIVYPDG
jgi:hypothetical protein